MQLQRKKKVKNKQTVQDNQINSLKPLLNLTDITDINCKFQVLQSQYVVFLIRFFIFNKAFKPYFR